ncbi:MAG: hypothetical protein CMB64_00800 [Euryarchaeota archaeon]|nr:hypothetical protein [Euryarchaeota archaeon]
MEADVPWFPCWGIKLDINEKDKSKLVKKFLEIRPNNRWLLLSKYAAGGERHLWNTWYLVEENFNENSALSKNPDAEFIRVISGTNQLKTAFKRAGLNDDDSEAWLLFLPEKIENLDFLPKLSIESFTEKAQKILYQIKASLITERPKPTKLGIERLGITFEGNQDLINEDLFISHLAKSSLPS